MDSLTDHFDAHTFEAQWENLTEEEKTDFIAEAADLEPEDAILPVLKGLGSYHYAIRNTAGKTLESIQSRIAVYLKDPDKLIAHNKGLVSSDIVCHRLYSLIEPTLPLNEQTFYLKTLLGIEGKGDYYAFKAVYLQRISRHSADKILGTLPERQRINFIDQVIQASPSVRLRFGTLAKQLLASIKDRQVVIDYLAHLFDTNRTYDPFLLNLPDHLTDPEQIEHNEIQSSSAETRSLGFKAYAMMMPVIPADILLDLLVTESARKVRMTIYKIIQNSSAGSYPDTFYPLFDLMPKIEQPEQFHVLKAMLVSGKLPIFAVLDLIRNNFPKLIPLLKVELSKLTRLSFLVIQDISLNKSYYEQNHFDLNLTCIFGLVKKRPERVVKVLKRFDNLPEDPIRLSITVFIEKTRKLLAQEKNDISTCFDDQIQQAEDEHKAEAGFLKNLFASDTLKKIDLLLSNQDASSINFHGKTICDAVLKNITFLSNAIYFNLSTIINCDFSNSIFYDSSWKKTVFYNIDMSGATFERANFDHAVFINVNAQKTTFINCSFAHASIFNCNFNHSSIKEACFTESIVSRSSFTWANLSGSTFSFARLSAVSFAKSNVQQADFSHAKARFCRFPRVFKIYNTTVDINENSRQYQLKLSDMPQMSRQVTDALNMLLFCEFIHYGETQFSRQNQMSLLTAFDIFKPRQAQLFHIIPYLLHENISFPGIDEEIHKSTPCGISDYFPDTETITVLKEYIKTGKIPIKQSRQPAIEGVFTIGSTGSVAQTSDSDIDYWICIHERIFSDFELKLLHSKLELIEKFSLQSFGIQITFFLVDIFKAKNNNFGDSSTESSGSAQARLLKEEFYRTMIHVAGKLPLWAVLPTPVSINYYSSINKAVIQLSDLGRFIDLGDIHAISTSEYFGASIWQMFKWLKSPFKSVIKMALLEKYIYEYGKKPLLCNFYKDQWMNSGLNLTLEKNDAYYILLENLIKYYRDQGQLDSVNILLTCFFLKLGIYSDKQIENTLFGLRKALLEKCLDRWRWGQSTVFEIGNFKSWQYTDIAKLSTTIENYMIEKYRFINQAVEKMVHNEASQISLEDKTVLGRKVLIEFSKQPGKVAKVLLISRSDQHFNGLHLRYLKKSPGPGTWELINRNTRAYQSQEESLIKARTIEEISAWLIHNGLYNESMVINLVPNPTFVTHEDIRKLFKSLNEFLGQVTQNSAGFSQLLQKSRVEHLFVSINFYAPKQQKRVTEYTLIYLTSWSEMFYKSVYSEKGFASMDRVKKDILNRLNIKKLPYNTAFYFSKGVARR